ncbi:MAG: HD domain-containing protein [Lachnospiraceae bacterium]|nr:HD domain-containing protein [Lachnospiraceae bacterium]
MQITLPEKVQFIINELEKAGYEAYAVGGCVRDSVLGRIPEDWDITTSAKPLEVKSVFRRTIDTGIQHGTVTVMLGNDGFEVTTYRIDGSYEDSRHPKDVTFTDKLTEDLRRRDFTINAMAYSDSMGIIDEFNGLDCIESRTIKAVGNAKERLTEDALRILRAIRFSAQLDYNIDDETKSAIAELCPNLQNISAERICTEIVKLLKSDHPDKLRDAYSLGITRIIMPEFDVAMETGQNTVHHMYTVGEHTLHALTNINNEKNNFTDRENRILKLTMLFHDLGKPSCKTVDEVTGKDHFTGHPIVSKEMCVSIMKRLKLDNDTINNVKVLVEYHDYRPKLTMTAVRKAIVKIGPDRMKMLFAVKRTDTMAQSEYMRDDKLAYIKEFEDKYNEIIENGDCISLKQLAVSGSDLIKAGVEAGPKLGEILNSLFEHVLDVPEHNTKDYLLEYSKRFM